MLSDEEISRLRNLYHAKTRVDGKTVPLHKPYTLARTFGISIYQVFKLVGDEKKLEQYYRSHSRTKTRREIGYYQKTKQRLSELEPEHFTKTQRARINKILSQESRFKFDLFLECCKYLGGLK